MSSEGAGTCMLAASMPLVASMGAGVLVEYGVAKASQWVSEQLEAYSNKWVNDYEQARREEERSRSQSVSSDLVSRLDAQATGRLFREIVADLANRQQQVADSVLFRQTLERARAELIQVETARARQQELDRQHLQAALQDEIVVANRMLLPEFLMQEAILALQGSTEELREMLTRLQVARHESELRLSEQELERLHLEEIVSRTRVRLALVEQMLSEFPDEQRNRFLEQRRALERLLPLASAQGKEALTQASRAHDAVWALMQEISNTFVEAHTTLNIQLQKQLGRLETLSQMLVEAGRPSTTFTLLNQQRAELHRQNQQLLYETQQLLEMPLLQARQQFADLELRSVELKEEIFAWLERFQQQIIASAIEETLLELRFQAAPGDTLLVRERGTSLRVVAAPLAQTAENQRDDRQVVFDISRNGDVRYDFIGYIGEGCIAEAERVFAALRQKGLYVVDQDVAKRMREAALRGQKINERLLKEYQHHPLRNKLQDAVAGRLLATLNDMQFEHIIQQVVGGVIEIDAFNGETGYHAAIRPEGTIIIARDEGAEDVEIELASDDPLAIAVREVIQEKKPAVEKQQVHKQQTSISSHIEHKLREEN